LFDVSARVERVELEQLLEQAPRASRGGDVKFRRLVPITPLTHWQ
jgi:hypothetical protein